MSRYWISGCMAVILAAAGRMPNPDDTTRSSRRWVKLETHLSVREAAAQIEAVARQGPTPVLIRTSPGGHAQSALDKSDTTVLVLGDPAGQTPVVQAQGDQLPDLPMGIVISRAAGGLTQVRYALPHCPGGSAALPSDWRARVEAMPDMIRSALA